MKITLKFPFRFRSTEEFGSSRRGPSGASSRWMFHVEHLYGSGERLRQGGCVNRTTKPRVSRSLKFAKDSSVPRETSCNSSKSLIRFARLGE